MESAQAFHARHEASLCASVVDLESLRAWMSEHRDELDEHPSAWCAIELAILDLLATESLVTVESLLGLPAWTAASITVRFSETWAVTRS